MAQTFTEKILAKKAEWKSVAPGQILDIRPDLTFSVDNTVRVQKIFKNMNAKKIYDPERHAIIFNHATR